MITFPEYERYDALGLAELIATGHISALEVVESAIERIEERNPDINAVIHKMYDEARLIASQPIPERDNVPFHGVPFLLKDLLAEYSGAPLRNGSRFFYDHISNKDSILVQRFKQAGLIVLGKTNTPEFGITAVTEPSFFGTTNNPWDISRTAGGSSGGSAAAVASGMVPMAHAGDGLGSIRIPASCCGLFGLKPSRYRTPLNTTTHEPWQGYVCEHVLTRSVRDSAAILDLLSEPDPHFPRMIRKGNMPFLREVERFPEKLRIAYTAEPFLGDKMDDECLKVLKETVLLCRELGHEMIEAAPQLDGKAYARATMTMLAGEVSAEIDEACISMGRRPSPADFEFTTWALGLLGGSISAGDFVQATRTMQRTAHTIHHFFTDYDLLLTPTLAEPPVLSGTMLPKGFEAAALRMIGRMRAGMLLKAFNMLETAADDSFRFTPFTPLFNSTGQPAMSVPLGWTDGGLPVGMQFVGRFADEATLFQLAGQLEQAQPWFHRTPKL